MPDDFYEYDGAPDRGRGHLFLWTIFILLLIGLAFGCWLGSFYIFGHPEQARPYRFLKKLHKIEQPKRFEITAAPTGEFLTAQRLFDRYSTYSPLRLADENAHLLRDYIKNFRETKRLVPYATGRYEIVKTYELQKTDLFQSGMVVLAMSKDHPQVAIEHLYPASSESVPKLRALLQPGLDVELKKTLDLSAVIHIERTDAGILQFTVVPLLYGKYLKVGEGSFSLEPPDDLNIPGGLPIVRGETFSTAVQSYGAVRRGTSSLATAGKEREGALVQVDDFKAGEKVPETGALPEIAAATPIPMATPPALLAEATPSRHGKPTPATQLAANTTPKPRIATPMPMAAGTPKPPSATPALAVVPPPPVATPHPAPSSVPLKPFIAAAPDYNTRSNGATWKTYVPGQLPAGKAVSPSEASTLADRGEVSEKIYLKGNFVVTASGENRAVLRASGTSATSGDSGKAGGGAARIIVEYPPSAVPPPEGSTFARGETAGFEIRDVRRGADGQINIYVREVTRSQ